MRDRKVMGDRKVVTHTSTGGPGLPSEIVSDIEQGVNLRNLHIPLNRLWTNRSKFYRAACNYAIQLLKRTRGVPDWKYCRWYINSSTAGWAISHGPWTDSPADSTIQLVGSVFQHPAPFPLA